MSTHRDVGRGVYPDEIGAVTHAMDRASLYSFTLTDGRRCRPPRHDGHPHLCASHARKDAQALAGDHAQREYRLSSFRQLHLRLRSRLRPVTRRDQVSGQICLKTELSKHELCLPPNPLKSTLAKMSRSVDSNRLTEKLSLLESVLTKNRGGGEGPLLKCRPGVSLTDGGTATLGCPLSDPKAHRVRMTCPSHPAKDPEHARHKKRASKFRWPSCVVSLPRYVITSALQQ